MLDPSSLYALLVCGVLIAIFFVAGCQFFYRKELKVFQENEGSGDLSKNSDDRESPNGADDLEKASSNKTHQQDPDEDSLRSFRLPEEDGNLTSMRIHSQGGQETEKVGSSSTRSDSSESISQVVKSDSSQSLSSSQMGKSVHVPESEKSIDFDVPEEVIASKNEEFSFSKL
ncbi:unnamed protein product [Notodromas monacha]|uniref:Uncharacterized protein n=1 Tax=Notodromas monacha TaxID=399045 RepID=A0A7R9BF77_9CRUS|nr:unnamed protein product [Notodromas monacha]CAG0914292.1 unnamed protein product [Notodromas monacha]